MQYRILIVRTCRQDVSPHPSDRSPYFLTPSALELPLNSRQNSLRSNYSFKSNHSSKSTISALSTNQCSDPQQIVKFGKNLSTVLPMLRGSRFLAILSAVFAFYAATVLGSVLLMIFAIWLS